MEGLTIPKEVYDKALTTLRGAYQHEFDETTETRYATRKAFVDAYRARYDFWNSRLPDIDIKNGPPAIMTIAMHAICSNALKNIVRHVNSTLGTTEEDPFGPTSC